MTNLSVNINKIATLRNSRGANTPDIVQVARDCEAFGAQGITVHPRPDERHVRYQDVVDLSKVLNTEFNIEGYPSRRFIDLVLSVKPTQVTLVPDPPGVLTSNAGWNVIENYDFLKKIISDFNQENIRTSLFMETDLEQIKKAAAVGVDRIELYTEFYARNFETKSDGAIRSYIQAAQLAQKLELGLNAGHDLNLKNLNFFVNQVPGLLEVSIGHALISDALYWGLERTIKKYLLAISSGMSS